MTALVDAPGDTARARVAGQLCVIGALIGAAGGLVMAVYPAAVGTDRFSYPFTPTGHRIAETSFAVNHILLIVGVLGLGWAGALAGSRLGRIGAAAAVLGLAALTLCEAGAFALAHSAHPSPETDRLDIGYGISTIGIGIGMVLAGVGVLRAGRWRGWARWTPLACGVAVFVLILPGVFTGSMVVGRLVLVAWMLLWAALGVAQTRRSERP